MRLAITKSLSPGARLGKDIYNEQGHILLCEGLTLTQKMIARLVSLNIPLVYIQDSRTDDIIPMPPVFGNLRREAINRIETTFLDMKNEMNLDGSFTMEQPNVKFTQIVRNIMDELNRNNELLTILADVYTYDDYIFTHSFNVTLYTLAIGMELNINNKNLEILGLGAILHDVGKMFIPLGILHKPGKLTEKEFEQIQKHADYGFHLIKNVHTVSHLVANCAYQHHERLDGSGYPRGIKGDEIHYFGKIIAVADVFDAVTSNRVYRKAMLPHQGLEILYAGIGKKFDNTIIEAFRRAVAIYPNGLSVELNDGRKGVVSAQNEGIGDRPMIRILEENGEQVKESYEVDLNKNLQLLIMKCLNIQEPA
ncbi:HD-GYP domain-containing protein [Peribacillus sp. CSMR9]|uniref:HD-GYP domain-containing protein n=1 Tax=Peribacillus sp. CSMR9 TaxID=2981350 RepID=UPI000B6251B1|nr:HD-GYP domain-containing protein [Peribacillus sp. CSMR9]MDV7765281.1 HD-GYP domain-containing protein [Peribacillus sp. CSMR9]SNS75460.1 HD domain-containing protein [Bacillus sp. OK838]